MTKVLIELKLIDSAIIINPKETFYYLFKHWWWWCEESFPFKTKNY